MLAPGQLRVRNRLYLLLLPIRAALIIANLAFHHAAVGGDVALGTLALLAALDLGGAPRQASGSAALACAVLYGRRSARWQGWRVATGVGAGDTAICFAPPLCGEALVF